MGQSMLDCPITINIGDEMDYDDYLQDAFENYLDEHQDEEETEEEE